MLKSKLLPAIPAALIAAALLHACGGGEDPGGGTSGSATVSAYVTDSPDEYESVNLTVNKVELRHPVTPACEIITGPLPINAAELEDQRGCLDEAIRSAALFPRHAGTCGDITIAAAVNRDVSLDTLAAALVLGDDSAHAVAFVNRVDHLRVQQQPHAGFPHELHRENFPPVRIDADG